MTVIINYKVYNPDDSYEIKSHIEKYCDGVISHGGNELLVVQGEDSARYCNVVQFSIVED